MQTPLKWKMVPVLEGSLCQLDQTNESPLMYKQS